MSTERALRSAYKKTNARGWDKVFWALDLHDTCFRSTYEKFTYEWYNEHVQEALLRLTALPETHLILWSSVFHEEKPHILKFFADAGIRVSGFNENPLQPSNETSCFDEKFYMSVIIDDKAGFDPAEWAEIPDLVDQLRKQYPPVVIQPARCAEETTAA